MVERRRIRTKSTVGALALGVVLAAILAGPATASATRAPQPVLAYYYIWFDPSSWTRAKTDYPLLGRYSSDERAVMRQHIRWAKAAGIDGFIVSWKSAPKLNDRLAKLIQVADQEHFKLGVIYQGLDFARNPLPSARVAGDLDFFLQEYASDRAFRILEHPLVVWSGTWEFSRAEVERVTRGLRGRLLVLASEHDTVGYRRLADLVDGNAYYWSSVNPWTFPHYVERLAELGRTVHAHGGLWIAPAAPGFDARLVGGTSVVNRNSGSTFRRELDATLGSSPDAVGIISWNEFSENSQIEPSEKYGGLYLRVLADVLGAKAPVIQNFDSDTPAATGFNYGLPLFIAFGLLFVAGLGARRAWRSADRAAAVERARVRDTEISGKGVDG